MSQFIFGLGIKSYVVLDWKINQDEITEKYCVNKDKPMMNCNGKCYLSKQLENLELKEEEERRNNPSPELLIESTNFVWLLESDSPKLFFAEKSNDADSFGFCKPKYWFSDINEDIDHPPKV